MYVKVFKKTESVQIVPSSLSMRIITAAKNEEVEMLTEFLNANEVDISFFDRENARNALHYAAEHNKRDLKTINMLLGHSSFSEKVLNQQDEFGYTPLDYAFYNFSSCKKDIIELLQSKGAKRRKELKQILPQSTLLARVEAQNNEKNTQEQAE